MIVCLLLISEHIMEAPNSKLNISVHLGQDSGQSTLAQVDVMNYAGEHEVILFIFRLTSSKRGLNLEEKR